MTVTTRRILLAGLVGTTLLLAGCGEADGGPVEASVRPAQETIVVTEADMEQPFALQPGRYKFGWDAPGCTGVDFTMTGAGQGFTYAKTSALPRFSAIVSNVPEDVYTLVQADAGCEAWTVQIDRIGS